MRRLAATLFLIISLLITSQAVTGPLEDATKAYDRGDYKTAYRLFKPMAEQGNADAQFTLGLMYFNGLGVPQDWEESAKWHRKAADQGHAPGQFALGQMYEAGHGVPQDYVLSHMWFNLAASRFSAFYKSYQFIAAVKINDVEKDMTPAQIAEAQKLAREWKPKKEK